MMPAVRKPYCAGSAPVISDIGFAQPRSQALAEQRQALGQLHAVEPVLQVAVVAAHMELAEAVLGDARRAQQHLVERRVVARGMVSMALAGEIVAGCAEAGLDAAARLVETRGGDGDPGQRRGLRCRLGLRVGLRQRRRA